MYEAVGALGFSVETNLDPCSNCGLPQRCPLMDVSEVLLLNLIDCCCLESSRGGVVAIKSHVCY